MTDATPLGNLYWYRHDGWQDGTERWTGKTLVGRSGWQAYKSVFASSDGVLYAIDWDGNLYWYRDDGWQDGADRWDARTLVGRGWQDYRSVFASSDGILYAIDWDGNLYWVRHDGWQNGTDRWTGRSLVARAEWLVYTTVFATSDGVLYGITPGGSLTWVRHDGWQDGTDRWTGKTLVGSGGWAAYKAVFATSEGVIYGVTPEGELSWTRHDGWQDGTDRWTGKAVVGRTGWDAYSHVFATTGGTVFAIDNNVASRIKHIVYLMLENRSVDNVLGWLYADGQRPDRVLAPPGHNAPDYNGLVPDTFFNLDANGHKHWIVRGTGGKLDIPAVDPNEKYEYINNQLFERKATPAHGTPPTMGGFYKDFAHWYESADQIMLTYTPAELPVLNGAARTWAVSDAYFASVPTQSNCNRGFAASGNSLAPDSHGVLEGWVNNHIGNWHNPIAFTVVFNQRTMYNVLQDAGKQSPADWMMYYSEKWESGYCYTRDMLGPVQDAKLDPHFDSIDTFFQRARAGTLPSVCFLEPAWGLKWRGLGWNGNDYHPPCNLTQGEQFVASILDALQSSPRWNETLFIINFDEHGGTYDHVPPPWTAAPPWGGDSTTPTPAKREQQFGFDRFGVRVPLILVSPYIEPKTVFRAGAIPYDHTSVLATILTMLGIPKDTWKLGNRVQQAPTFHHVLTRSTPRTDITRFEPSAAALAADAPVVDPPPTELQRGIASRVLQYHLARHPTVLAPEVAKAVNGAKTISELARALARATGEVDE